MATAHIATVLALALTGFLPSSCTKTSAAKKTGAPVVANAAGSTNSNQSVTANPTNNKDLGVLNLTNHLETTIDLGAGKICRIAPRMLGRKDLQLTLTLETKQADGQTAGLNITQVTVRPGKTFDISIGDVKITLTPNFVDQ